MGRVGGLDFCRDICGWIWIGGGYGGFVRVMGWLIVFWGGGGYGDGGNVGSCNRI